MRFPVAIAVLFTVVPIAAQTTPDLTSSRQMAVLTRNAARIFSGQVLKIEHKDADAGSPATTVITLRVENPVRGVRRGQVVQVREWGVLWNEGERFREGEHVFLFLYADSRLGLTSPVKGNLGHYVIDRDGRVHGSRGGVNRNPVTVRKFVAAIRRAAAVE
jgi:hypothetical protein